MLILVRHGRTGANAGGRMQGRIDHPLDDLGEQQARDIAASLRRVDRIISSPAQRARQTAAALAAGDEVEVDGRWAELDFGVYDDLALGDVPPEVWRQWRSELDWAPPGGESIRSVRDRVWAACDELLDEMAERDVVVVSHVSPIKQAVGWALELDARTSWRTHLDVASISRIAVRGGEPLLVSFNEIRHLGSGTDPVVYGVNWR